MSVAPIAVSTRYRPAVAQSSLAPSLDFTRDTPLSITTQSVSELDSSKMACTPNPFFAFSDYSASYCLNEQQQRYCSDYACCHTNHADLHALLAHYEDSHHAPQLGTTARPVLRLPAVSYQPVVTPLLPVASHFAFSSELVSALSPASTAYSERSVSLGFYEDDDHLDKGLDTAPQTPAVSPRQSFNVTIVGTHDTPEGFMQNLPMYQIGSPLVTTRNISNVAPKVAPAYPPVGVPQPPLLAVGHDVRRQAEPSQQAPAVPPFDRHSYTLGSAFDVDAGRIAEVQPEESYYRPPASAVYPLTQQHRLPRPQIPRQSSMHSIPSAIPALTPARSHSIHVPSREKAYPLMQNAAQPQQPLVASPSPSTEMPQLSPARLTPSRIRTNGSAPFPQQSTEPSSPSSPQTTGTKRSYDEIDGSELEEEDAQGEEEIDEDADGEEDESELSPAMQALVNRPAVIIPRDSKGQAKEKRAKTGRPKSTRASAQKDPKRAKLFCPRPGCTKRYMNPNGLKYHLEKGTCTIEV